MKDFSSWLKKLFQMIGSHGVIAKLVMPQVDII